MKSSSGWVSINHGERSDHKKSTWSISIRVDRLFPVEFHGIHQGWKTVRCAMVMPSMIKGYKNELLNLSMITCTNPGKMEPLPVRTFGSQYFLYLGSKEAD